MNNTTVPLAQASSRGCRGSGSRRRIQAYQDVKNSESMACLDMYLAGSLFCDFIPSEEIEQAPFYQYLNNKDPIVHFPSPSPFNDESEDEFEVQNFDEFRSADPISSVHDAHASFVKPETLDLTIPYPNSAVYHTNEPTSDKVDIPEVEIPHNEYFDDLIITGLEGAVIVDTRDIPCYQELNQRYLDHRKTPAPKGKLFVAHEKLSLMPNLYVRDDDPMNKYHSPVLMRRTSSEISPGFNTYVNKSLTRSTPTLQSSFSDFMLRWDDPLNLETSKFSCYVHTKYCVSILHYPSCSYLAPCLMFFGYATNGEDKHDIFAHEDHYYHNGDLTIMVHFYVPPDLWGKDENAN